MHIQAKTGSMHTVGVQVVLRTWNQGMVDLKPEVSLVNKSGMKLPSPTLEVKTIFPSATCALNGGAIYVTFANAVNPRSMEAVIWPDSTLQGVRRSEIKNKQV